MRIVERKPRFDPETGHPCGHSTATRYHRCDYCGEVLPASEGGHRPNLLLTLEYAEVAETGTSAPRKQLGAARRRTGGAT